MELATARLRVDALRPADAEGLFACRADPAVARYQGWCPADLAAAREFIDAQRQPPSSGWCQRAIRLRESGMLIGDLGLCLPEAPQDSVEVGVSIAPAYEGRGYASVALLRALGMRQEAHHRESLWLRGAWVDDVIFALLDHEWRALSAGC